MTELIQRLSKKFPHLDSRQFAAEVWANILPNRYSYNTFLKKYWEGSIPNENEIDLIRKGHSEN